MLLTKLMVFLFTFAILVVLREMFAIYKETRKENGKYAPSIWRMVAVGVAISFIVTVIFTGFSLV